MRLGIKHKKVFCRLKSVYRNWRKITRNAKSFYNTRLAAQRIEFFAIFSNSDAIGMNWRYYMLTMTRFAIAIYRAIWCLQCRDSQFILKIIYLVHLYITVSLFSRGCAMGFSPIKSALFWINFILTHSF